MNEGPTRNLRDRLRRAFLGTLLSLSLLAALAYGVDWTVLRVRIAGNWTPYGSVIVNHYYAVLQKNGKTQFIFDPPQQETCVHSLLPHSDFLPCWYLSKHPDQRTDI